MNSQMMNREMLSEEHAELDALAVRVLALVGGPREQAGELSAVRWRLTHVLMVHLAKEDKLLYPLLQASSIAAIQVLAARFAQEMGGLAEQYLAYSAKWTVSAVDADWRGFGADSRRVMRLLRLRIAREEHELYPLMERKAA